jgi:hypothetical protein
MPLEAKVAPPSRKSGKQIVSNPSSQSQLCLGLKNRGGKGRLTRIQLRTTSNDQSRQTEAPEQSLGGQ